MKVEHYSPPRSNQDEDLLKLYEHKAFVDQLILMLESYTSLNSGQEVARLITKAKGLKV